MRQELEGKTAIVTGASKGIGLAIVRGLTDAGATVIAGARSSSPGLDELVAQGVVRFISADLGEPDGPAAFVAEAGAGIDILVNNVGATKPRVDGFLAVTDDQWIASLNLNLLAAVRTTRAVLPGMLEAGHGSIVTVGSVNAFLPDPGVIDYSASKGALLNFMKSISKEFGGRGIRANTVSPGPVETDLWLAGGGVADTIAKANGLRPEEVASAAVATTATGRFSHPEEIADLVVFLASDRAANLTGASVTIDGGLVQTL
ncbi:oxidoreductase [Herbiconiux daphne]|uniref:Oxidoreductase n=1 Tax=Herbiconiux daphne TaxID=2970914 RepID=A0ABT2GZP8_9MICO|nr:oxidoreductase [Herbiconiux daphne]MCS5733402.1 oxidoreductase [Herbiconiux daphne]